MTIEGSERRSFKRERPPLVDAAKSVETAGIVGWPFLALGALL